MDCILYIQGGEIKNKSVVRKFFKSLRDGKFLLKADAFKKRTLPQNAYYRGVVVPMVLDGLRDAGYNEVKTNDDAHEILKHLFLKRKHINEKTGEEIIIAGSTADLKTVEFNSFLEDIWQWAAAYLNISIPQPNEQLVMFDRPAIAAYDNDVSAVIIE